MNDNISNLKIYKPCEKKCERCAKCRSFAALLRQLQPNDVQSKLKRHAFEWREK